MLAWCDVSNALRIYGQLNCDPAAPFIGKRKAIVIFNPTASVYLFIVFCFGRARDASLFIFSTMKISH